MKPIVISLSIIVCQFLCIDIYANELPQNIAQIHDKFCYKLDIRLSGLHKIGAFLRTSWGPRSKLDISFNIMPLKRNKPKKVKTITLYK